MKKITYKTGCWFLILIFFSSCTTVQEISTSGELRENRGRDVQIETKDNAKYKLTEYMIVDSTIVCEGYKYIGDKETPFRGKISIKDLKYIETEKFNIERTLIAIGISAVVIIALLDYAKNDNGINSNSVVKLYVPAGGGSCM